MYKKVSMIYLKEKFKTVLLHWCSEECGCSCFISYLQFRPSQLGINLRKQTNKH